MPQFEYKGWVPTVGQRLSFSIIGHSKHPTSAITSNVADEKTRRIICYQYRPSLLDSAIPFFKHNLAKLLFSLESEFRFLCVARSENDSNNLNKPLTGTVYIFQNKKTWKNSVEPIVKPAQNSLNQYDRQLPLDDYYNNYINKQLASVAVHAIYYADFELQRNGLITIQPSTASIFKNPTTDLEYFRNQILSDADLQDRVSSQIFYFLKDIAHVHQHHHPTTDTIVRLYRKDVSETDLGWMNNTLRVLYSKILEYKRIKDEEIHAAALGVMAYVKAFAEIAKKEVKPTEVDLLALRNNETLECSINASQTEYQAGVNRRSRLSDTFKNTLISIASFLVSLASLTQLIDDDAKIQIDGKFNYVKETAELIINHPIYSLALITSVVTMLLMYEGVIPWKKSSIIRDLTRIFHAIPRTLSVVLMFLLALGSIYVTIKLVTDVPRLTYFIAKIQEALNSMPSR
ncbi:MAG: hypothetical protein QM709_03170 [Spongiibacteraceae bacterium]